MRASRLTSAAAIFGAWTVVGLLSIAPDVLAQLSGEGRPVRFRHAVLTFESVWLWAAFTPAIWWLARRFPINRRTLTRNLLIHFVLANGFNVLDALVDRVVLPPVGVSLHRS